MSASQRCYSKEEFARRDVALVKTMARPNHWVHVTLCLWKQKRRCKKSALEIFNQLCDGKEVAELAAIRLPKIVQRLKVDFPGIEEKPGALDWEAPKGKTGLLQVSWSPRHV